MTTKLDRGRVSDEDRAAAARFLERKGFADLLDVLGLVDEKPVVALGPCPTCGNKRPSHGVCRRGRACREAAQELTS